MSEEPGAAGAAGAGAAVFRLPRTTYLVVLFLLFGCVPLAFTADGFAFGSGGDAHGAPAVIGAQTLLLLIPILAGLYVARTATFVDASGLRVRAAFGSRTLGWDGVRGLSVTGSNVYAVTAEGAVRLPCVGTQHLAAIALASRGRLPALPAPRLKSAPHRRRS